jgi:hypothetical protein
LLTPYFRWTFVAVWLVGMPIGLYLTFVTRPTYELRGIWIGLIVGMGLLAGVMLLQVLMLDWEKEARKAEYRLLASGQAYEDAGPGAGADLDRAEAGEEPGIVMNPMGGGSRASGVSRSGRAGSVAMPVIGSQAVGEMQYNSFLALVHGLTAPRILAGGFPMDHVHRSAEEELAEIEFVEFGSLPGVPQGRNDGGSAGKGGAASLSTEVPAEAGEEDEEQHKRLN